MDKTEFMRLLSTIMYEEGWQTKKGQTIKSCIANQRRAINTLAKRLHIEKLSTEEVLSCSFG